MDRLKLEQRCAIKFCVKLGESPTVTYEKLQRAYGEHSLSRAQVLFRRPRTSGRRTSCGKTFNLKNGRQCGKRKSLMRSDRRLTLRMINNELNLNRCTVHQILTQDLDMRKVCAEMVPKNLTTEQKANRRDVS